MISVGANAKYIFGEIDESNKKTIIADPDFLSSEEFREEYISDFTFDFGTQLKFEFGEYRLITGVYALGQDLNARQISTQYTLINSGIKSVKDTSKIV